MQIFLKGRKGGPWEQGEEEKKEKGYETIGRREENKTSDKSERGGCIFFWGGRREKKLINLTKSKR